MQAVQFGAQLFKGALGEVQLQIRLGLPGDAAHILAAKDGALIHAAGHQTVRAAHDAAHIVAQMFVAHRAGVIAAEDHAGGAACNAAGIGGSVGRKRFGAGIDPLLHVCNKVCGQAVQIQGSVLIIGVHGTYVGAAGNAAQILARDAAGAAFAGDNAAGRAAVQHTGCFIAAHDAAYLTAAFHRAGELAVCDGALVDACNAAHGAFFTAGGHPALHAQRFDDGTLLHGGKQTGGGVGAFQFQIADLVAVTAEAAAEGRDGLPVDAGQGDVLLQDHGLAPGPAVHGTVLCQRGKVIRTVDINGIAILYRLGALGKHRQGRGPYKRQCQHQRHAAPQAAEKFTVPVHRYPPAPASHYPKVPSAAHRR